MNRKLINGGKAVLALETCKMSFLEEYRRPNLLYQCNRRAGYGKAIGPWRSLYFKRDIHKTIKGQLIPLPVVSKVSCLYWNKNSVEPQ